MCDRWLKRSLFFKYINKRAFLTFSKRKFVSNFPMGLIFGFEDGGGEALFFKLPRVREFLNI